LKRVRKGGGRGKSTIYRIKLPADKTGAQGAPVYGMAKGARIAHINGGVARTKGERPAHVNRGAERTPNINSNNKKHQANITLKDDFSFRNDETKRLIDEFARWDVDAGLVRKLIGARGAAYVVKLDDALSEKEYNPAVNDINRLAAWACHHPDEFLANERKYRQRAQV